MRFVLDALGGVLLLQGLLPLAQVASGIEGRESLFVVNQAPELLPWTAVALAAAGGGLLWIGRRLRRQRESAQAGSGVSLDRVLVRNG